MESTSYADQIDAGVGLSDASGSYLEPAAREAAIARAISTLGTYFSSGVSVGMRNYRGVQRTRTQGDSVEELLLALRLRVGLAAARRLLQLLNAVLRRPNFRYSLVPVDSVGVVTGQLDTRKYLERLATSETPFIYPTLSIERAHLTPENVMTAYAASWIAYELRDVVTRITLPSHGPESRAITSVLSDLRRITALPAFAVCRPAVRDVFRQRSEVSLVDGVGRRLVAGHVAGARVYQDIVDWLRECFAGLPIARPGDIDWQFYDDRFDSKLFELWCLSGLADQLTAKLGSPIAPMSPMSFRGLRPLLEWKLGPSRVRLHFQEGLAKLGTSENTPWRYVRGASGHLRGLPDIAVEILGLRETRTVILVDPKLRQRDRVPAEEIYKLLGYFGNLQIEQPPLGAIIFYSPASDPVYALKRDGGGELYAIGVDPLREPISEQALSNVANLVLAATGVPERLMTRIQEAAYEGDPLTAQEMTTSARQEATIRAMLQVTARLPEPTLAPYRKSCAAALTKVWSSLSKETQTMLVTAEYFGMTAPDDADHSGPLLGLAAACERLLYERLLNPLLASGTHVLAQDATFGTIIRWLTDASRASPRSPEGSLIRSSMLSGALGDLDSISRVSGDLRQLNVHYRIPAAHRDVVTHDKWVEGRNLVLNPTRGLLVRLCSAIFGESSKTEPKSGIASNAAT